MFVMSLSTHQVFSHMQCHAESAERRNWKWFPSFRTLCPTRWTVWAESLSSILANYKERQLLGKRHHLHYQTPRQRLESVGSQVRWPPSNSFSACEPVGNGFVTHRQAQQDFAEPWTFKYRGPRDCCADCENTAINPLWFRHWFVPAEHWNVEEARLPRKRKVPKCYEQGDDEAEFHAKG